MLWIFSCFFTWECVTLLVVSNSVAVPCRKLWKVPVDILIALPWLSGLLRTILESLATCQRMEFIDIGFVTAESSAKFCSCPLFDMDLEFLDKSETKWLKWLRGNVHTVMTFFKRSKLFHSSWEKLHLIRISVSWFLGVNVSYLNLGIKIDPIEEQIKSNPLSSWHMSHEGTSSFHYHLDNSFVIFKDKQLGVIFRRMCVTGHVFYLSQFICSRCRKLLDVLFRFFVVF